MEEELTSFSGLETIVHSAQLCVILILTVLPFPDCLSTPEVTLWCHMLALPPDRIGILEITVAQCSSEKRGQRRLWAAIEGYDRQEKE